MKQSAFLLKSFLVVTMMGWTLMSNAQRYEIEHGRVYFGDEVMMQADARSFVDLGCGYAKDRMNVYMNGHVLENVDPSTFRLKERSTWRHHGRDGKDEPTSENRGYFKTNFNVYFGNKKNRLEVEVLKESTNPQVNLAERRADYWNFGGIWRPVFIISKPAQNIERVAINAKGDGQFMADVFLNRALPNGSVSVNIVDANGKVTAVGSGTAYIDVYLFQTKACTREEIANGGGRVTVIVP